MNKKQRRRHRFTSNKNLLTLVAFFLVLLAITACTSSIRKNQTIVAKENFVSVKDGKFMLDNEIFRFVGTNNYYMHYSTDKMILDVLNDADNMGFTVLRIWGFQIGPNKDHNSYGLNSPARGKNLEITVYPKRTKVRHSKQTNLAILEIFLKDLITLLLKQENEVLS